MSDNKLYRFFSLPGNIFQQLIFDNIKINNNTTINDILQQRMELQRKINGILFPAPNQEEQKLINSSLEPYNLPEPYFSLYRINYLIHDQMLWLSKLENLNDISEHTKWMMPKLYEQLLEKEKDRMPTQEEIEGINKEAERFDGWVRFNPLYNQNYYGVVSFCKEEPINSLMWSHYANGHFGVCVGFDVHSCLQDIMISPKRALQGYYPSEDGSIGSMHTWQTIDYVDTPENLQIDMLEHYEKQYIAISQENRNFKKFVEDPDAIQYMIISNLINLKQKCWAHESEVRLLLTGWSNKEGIRLSRFVESKSTEPYLIPSNLYFGYQVDPQIQTVIRNSVKTAMRYWIALPKGGTFGIKFSKLD